jgi:hypothetical protein
MKKHTKFILGVLAVVIGAVIYLLVDGLYAMDIEDHYGDLQTVYYQADDGDLIIDNKNRYGFLKKVSNRIYVEEDDYMRDLNSWVNISQSTVKFSVYKFKVYETWITRPSYVEIKRLINEQKLKAKISN